MVILVTGGAGFIGSHLVDALLKRGEKVVCIDDFNDSYDPKIKRGNIAAHLANNQYHLVQGDIRDVARLNALFESYPIEKIVHLAARAGLRPSLQLPMLYEDVNVRATIQLLEMTRKYQVKQFVFASSVSECGPHAAVPFREEDRIDRSLSPDAASKYPGELMCHTYHHLYGIPVTCLRFFRVYGPRQRPDTTIHKFAHLMYKGHGIVMFGGGSSARDYTYIDDIVHGILAAIDHPYEFEVFNLGGSATITLRNLVHLIEQISEQQARIIVQPEQPGDVEITHADSSKARRMLGYDPRTPIEDGVQSFIAWYEEAILGGSRKNLRKAS